MEAGRESSVPCTREEWDQVTEICRGLVNATLADDGVLHESKWIELSECCEELMERYGPHPVHLETLADFADQPEERLDLYSRASAEAVKRGLPLHTIHTSWADSLLDHGRDPRAALGVLERCAGDISLHADAWERTEYEEVLERARKEAAPGA